MNDGAGASTGTCACGNAGSTTCVECRDPVCGLCVRTLAKGNVCLACRSSAIKLEEERERRARVKVTATRPALRVRKTWIFLPGVIVLAITVMATVVGSVLSEAGGARSERRAREVLKRVVEAEEAFHRATPDTYAPLDTLLAKKLYEPMTTPGYSVRVEVAKDGHTFWARAVPEREGLRSMIMDARGVIVYDGGDE